MTQGLYFGTLLLRTGEVFYWDFPLPAPSSHSSSLWLGWVGLGGAISLLIPQTRSSYRSEPWSGCSHWVWSWAQAAELGSLPTFPEHLVFVGLAGAAVSLGSRSIPQLWL